MMNHNPAPTITLCETDHRQLLLLTMLGSGPSPKAEFELFHELNRAQVVSEARLADDVVRMGSTVSYREETGEVHNVTLVYPAQADTSVRISVLTPVGMALIGHRAGQSTGWRAAGAKRRSITVLSVTQRGLVDC